MAGFELASKGSSIYGAVGGVLSVAKQTVSTTGAKGTAVEIGAISAAQFLYATLHVFSAGTTITVIIESDDNGSFTSATTRATLGPVTARGGTWLTRVAGPVTDTFWRMNVSAVTGSFVVAGAIGIQ